MHVTPSLRRRISATCVAVLFSVAFGQAYAQQQPRPNPGGIRSNGMTLLKAQQLVTMVNATIVEDGNAAHMIGSGIIAGNLNGALYVVTARHVVWRSHKADTVTVMFHDYPGQAFDASVLAYYDDAIDLAVLLVSRPPAGIIAALDTHVLRADKPPMGADMFYVGQPNGSPWQTNLTPGRLATYNDVTITFETSVAVEPGNSGGGLFDGGYRLLGMVTRQLAPSRAEAIPFARIASVLSEQNYPIFLVVGPENRLDESRHRPSPPNCDVTVTATVPQAAVEVDGRPFGGAPAVFSVDSGRQRTVRVTASGFAPFTGSISCDRPTLVAQFTAPTPSSAQPLTDRIVGEWAYVMTSEQGGGSHNGRVRLSIRNVNLLTQRKPDGELVGDMDLWDKTAGVLTGHVAPGGNTIELSRDTGLSTLQHYQLVEVAGGTWSGRYWNTGQYADAGRIVFRRP